MIKKRHPLIAALLSGIIPGLGQIYNGQLRKGIIYYFANLFGYLLYFVSGLQKSFHGLVIFCIAAACFYLFIIAEAAFVAFKKKKITLQLYNRWYVYIFSIIICMIIGQYSVLLVQDIYGLRAYRISSSAMEPTLLLGDHIYADNKYYINNKVQREDIIVFIYPIDRTKSFLKRVIAVGGDVIEIRDKKVFVNDTAVTDAYAIHKEDVIFPKSLQPRDNFGPIKVPEGAIFVMGDNRDQSYDSRFWGFVKQGDVIGKPLYIYWSWDSDNYSVRWNRLGLSMH